MQPIFTTTNPDSRPEQLRGSGQGPVHPTTGILQPLPFGAIEFEAGFMSRLQAHNGARSIKQGDAHLNGERTWENFDTAATGRLGEHFGPVFEDGEAYKWLEAVAWEAGRSGDEQLRQWLATYTKRIAAAQDPDGYINTFNQIAGKRGRYEWLAYDHEIFNIGALIQAGVAQYRATGSVGLLDVARRAADHLYATFGDDKRIGTCGHPLVEMALVELYRVTQDRRYLALASFFVEVRGRRTLTDPSGHFHSVYYSDRIPVRETEAPEGHAVRALYFASGATDVAVETGDTELLSALLQQWQNMVDTKMYVNGGLGSRWEGEAFGDPYELPADRAFGETCAAIASMQWSWRLLLATGESKYADLIERQFYNAVLSGVSLDGDKYFYVNALQVRGDAVIDESRNPASGRHEWFGCSCCPTNLMRTIASIHEYVATQSSEGVQVHQFANATVAADVGGQIRVRMTTGYPWDGAVRFEVLATTARQWELRIRVPGWASGATVQVDGASPSAVAAGNYFAVKRKWEVGDMVELVLPMAPRERYPHPRVDAVRGSVAIERGPILYAIEQVDQVPGVSVDDVQLLNLDIAEEFRADVLGGVPMLTLTARSGRDDNVVNLIAIPYFMWANRQIGPMRVWLPLAD